MEVIDYLITQLCSKLCNVPKRPYLFVQGKCTIQKGYNVISSHRQQGPCCRMPGVFTQTQQALSMFSQRALVVALDAIVVEYF